MFRLGYLRSSTNASAILALAALTLSLVAARAAMPFNSAVVTRVENGVSYGEANNKRRAAVNDVIRANNFLLTEADSRAELKYEDGSIVRIGQNTVFSFDAQSRTLSLEKGSLIFYIPKGSGGGTVKTASLTAAITGTIGKVSANSIAILEGTITLRPSGIQVGAGQIARIDSLGNISVGKFDPKSATEGKLMRFGGKIPGFDEKRLAAPSPKINLLNTSIFDALDRTQNQPSSIERFFPQPVDKTNTDTKVPPPDNTPPATPPHGGTAY